MILCLLAAVIAFVGTHELLSHPLRAPLVARIGERGFQALYSVVAFITGGWAVWAFRAAPVELLWTAPALFWQLAAPLMLIASILLAGSILDPNPALPGAQRHLKGAPVPRGVLRITRHPMMWSFALWGLVHVLVAGTSRSLILGAGVVVLALFGAAMQDRKKLLLLGDGWAAWRSRTAFVPFAAQLGGKLPGSSLWPGWRAVVGGAILFLGATWAHPLLGAPLVGFWGYW